MRYGTCVGARELDRIAIAKAAGYDYVETCIKELYTLNGGELEAFAEQCYKSGIGCEAGNCFIKNDMRVVGLTANDDLITQYLDDVMQRCSTVGIKTIVYGSGGSRNWEEGFSPKEAYGQCVRFLRELAAVRAQKLGMCIAVEPLIRRASMMIHLVSEGIELARATGSPCVGGLADIYHMYANDDPVSSIRSYKGELIHAHISNPVTRDYPLDAGEYDYKAFLDALDYAGCTRCTIEAETENFEADAYKACELLHSL